MIDGGCGGPPPGTASSSGGLLSCLVSWEQDENGKKNSVRGTWNGPSAPWMNGLFAKPVRDVPAPGLSAGLGRWPEADHERGRPEDVADQDDQGQAAVWVRCAWAGCNGGQFSVRRRGSTRVFALGMCRAA